MPNATLLLREDNSSGSLAALVEKSQQQQRNKTLPEYQIELNSCQLDLILIKNEKPVLLPPPSATTSTSTSSVVVPHHQQDEGFESDIDSLSIVSSDGSITTKTAETDSANGSASSDSDTEPPTPPPTTVPSLINNNNPEITNKNENYPKESYNLVDCVCYTDVKFPNLLIFAIKQEGLVFQFENLNNLRSFYLNFTALKAVTNQKAYSKSSAKFNLLQRTDNNGVTHIEITREPEQQTLFFSSGTTATTPITNIISLNTPETVNRKQQNHNNNNENKKNTLPLSRNYNNFQDNSTAPHYRTLSHYASSENILKLVNKTSPSTKSNNEQLRKVWNSAEDLLNSSTTPKRPDRRKKIKGRAPPPPAVPSATTPAPPSDVLRGEYVRVNVIPDTVSKESSFIAKSQLKESKKPVTRSNLVTLLSSSSTHLKSNRLLKIEPPSWTNSVPRLLKTKHYQPPHQQLVPQQQHPLLLQSKQRSKSETRTFTPMAYRYIDTAPMYTPPMGNRLFGLSSKLRDFSNIAVASATAEGRSGGTLDYKKRSWCASTSNIDSSTAGCCSSTTSSSSNSKNNLKSVIKKDENRKSTKTNEKKVTFSAYTTVQVV